MTLQLAVLTSVLAAALAVVSPEAQVALYMAAFGLIGALTQALKPKCPWLPFSIPGPVSALGLATLAIVQAWLEATQHGMSWGLGFLTAFGTGALGWFALLMQLVAWLKTGKEPAPVPESQKPTRPEIPPPTIPPAAALLLVLLPMANANCGGTFEEVRPKTPLASLNVLGAPVLLSPGSPECRQLSFNRSLWKGLGLAAGPAGLAGTAAGLVELAQKDPEQKTNIETYIFFATGGAFSAASLLAFELSQGYGGEYVAAGCAGTPAP